MPKQVLGVKATEGSLKWFPRVNCIDLPSQSRNGSFIFLVGKAYFFLARKNDCCLQTSMTQTKKSGEDLVVWVPCCVPKSPVKWCLGPCRRKAIGGQEQWGKIVFMETSCTCSAFCLRLLDLRGFHALSFVCSEVVTHWTKNSYLSLFRYRIILSVTWPQCLEG